MIAPFTLDTSGAVARPSPETSVIKAYRWPDLDDFTQGYVEALFRTSQMLVRGCRIPMDAYGFSDLAPETLALILKDCAAYQAHRAFDPLRDLPGVSGVESLRNAGREFWHVRSGQEDYCHGFKPGDWPDFSAEPLNAAARAFPPLTPYLGDDGKVYLREGA